MHVVSFHFLILVAAGLVFFHKFCNSRWRLFILSVLSAVIVASYANKPTELLPLAGFLLLGFFCVRLVQRWPFRPMFITAVAIIIGAFIYLKQYSFFEFSNLLLTMPYVVVGLSYILFRVLQLMIDSYQGAIREKISLPRFLVFSCFFLSFISGPIQRYQEFQKQANKLSELSLTPAEAHKAFSRIANGCIKVVILSAACHDCFTYFHRWIEPNPHGDFLWAAYSAACLMYFMDLYINFSGYMDIVIGVGGLYGFNLPENFAWPLGAGNFIEFWNRWHMTLSEWFKFYVFNPIVKSFMQQGKDPRWIPYYGVLAYFITFFLMGLWHGTTYVFAIYGLFLGFGMALTKLYEVEMRKRLGKKRFSILRNSYFYGVIAQSLTLSYFAIALTSLWLNATQFWALFQSLGLVGTLNSAALCMVAIAFFILIYDLLIKCLRPASGIFCWLGQNPISQQLGLSFRVILVMLALYGTALNLPKIIYMDF